MMNLKYYLRGLGIGIVVTALIMGIAAGGKKQVLTDEEIMERARELGMVEESTVLADTVAGESANAASGPEGEANEPAKSEVPTPLEKTPQPQDMVEKTPVAKDGEASPSAAAEKTAVPSPIKTPESQVEKTPAPSAEKVIEPETSLESEEENEPEGPAASPPPDAGGQDEEEDVQEAPATEETAAPENPSLAAGEVSPQSGSIQINSGEGSYTVSVRLQEAGLVSSAAEFDRYLFQNGYDRRIRTGVFEIPAGADPERIAKIITRAE